MARQKLRNILEYSKRGIGDFRKKQREGKHMSAMNPAQEQSHTCLNCGTEFRGDYCPHCRQKASTKRLNISGTMLGYYRSVTHSDHGLKHTIVDLLYRPGYMVRDYLKGHRAEYVDPVMLLLLIIAVEILIPGSGDDFNPKPFPEQYRELLAPYPVSLRLTQIWHWIFGNQQRSILFITILCSPAIVLTMKILRVKKNVPNLSEAFHMILYSICYVSILSLFLSVLEWIFPNAIAAVSDPLDIALCVIMFLVMFAIIKACTGIGWRKMLPTMVLVPLIALICTTGFILLLAIVYYIDLPKDILDQIKISSLMS